jgi:hypothetical protein
VTPEEAAKKAADKVWAKAYRKLEGGDPYALDHAYKNAYNAALKAARSHGMAGVPAVQVAVKAAQGPEEK